MADKNISQPLAQAAAITPADGAQPPLDQAATAAQADMAFAREENARTVLRGDAKEPESAEQTSQEGMERQREIDSQFDPETGELLEAEENAESGNQKAEIEAVEAAADEGEEAAPVEEETETDEDGGKGKGKRIRIRRDSLSDRDFAILTLAKEKRVSFSDAERQLFGGADNTAAVGTAKPGEAEPAARLLTGAEGSAASPSAPTAAQIGERITALRAERDAATDANDAKRVNQLNDQLADLRDTLHEARQTEAVQRQAARQTARMRYATVETEAIHRAAELFPDAKLAGSELNEVMKAKAASLRQEDPAYFDNPRWPILLTVETAATLGIAPRGKPAPAQEIAPKTAGQVIPRKVTRPAPSPAPGTSTSASQLNSESALRAELKAATASRDVDAIKAVMRKIQQ